MHIDEMATQNGGSPFSPPVQKMAECRCGGIA